MSTSNQQEFPTIWTKNANGILQDNCPSDSSSDEEPQVRMRVGEMYQAKIPKQEDYSGRSKFNSKEGMLIWSPCDSLAEEKLDNYCQTAKEKHSYNVEQALGMLFWHKHDIKKSLSDMQNFTPMPDEWSMEDKVLFEQAYTFHGKNFRKIQQLIPDKEISQLVKHYYTWKKTRVKTSLMDKQANKRTHGNDSDNSPSNDYETMVNADEQKPPPSKVQILNNEVESKHKLPKGIQLCNEDINVLAGNPKGAEGHLALLDGNLVELKSQIQLKKQECGKLTSKMNFLQCPQTEVSPTDIWTEQEILLTVEGIRDFGENYSEISEMLTTKTASQVKEFLSTHRKDLNIDKILSDRKDNGFVNSNGKVEVKCE